MKIINDSNILHFYRMEKNPFGNTANNQLRLGCEVKIKIILFFFLKNVKLLIIPDWNVPLCLEIFRLARASVWLLLLFRLRGRGELSK